MRTYSNIVLALFQWSTIFKFWWSSKITRNPSRRCQVSDQLSKIIWILTTFVIRSAMLDMNTWWLIHTKHLFARHYSDSLTTSAFFTVLCNQINGLNEFRSRSWWHARWQLQYVQRTDSSPSRRRAWHERTVRTGTVDAIVLYLALLLFLSSIALFVLRHQI